MAVKLIVGLGNIGPEYEKTRHNAGFIAVNNFAVRHGLQWQEKSKFRAAIAEGGVEDQKIILAKPTTYMNLSGEALRAIKDFYKITNDDILVIHDELALPFGTVRTRIGGNDAGNNGIKSVIGHIGPDFARIRIGIENDKRPLLEAADFVLSRFTAEEQASLEKLYKIIDQIIIDFTRGNFKDTTYQSTK